MKKLLQTIVIAFLVCAATANAEQALSNKHNHGKRTSVLIIEHELTTKFNDSKSYLVIRDFCVFGMQYITVIPIRQRVDPIAMNTTQVIGSDGKPMLCKANRQPAHISEPDPN